MFSGLAGLRSLETSISSTARSDTCLAIFSNRRATCSRSSSVTGRLRPLTSIRMGLLSSAPAVTWEPDATGRSQRPHIGGGAHPSGAALPSARARRRRASRRWCGRRRRAPRRAAAARSTTAVEAARAAPQRPPRADLPPPAIGAPQARRERQPGPRRRAPARAGPRGRTRGGAAGRGAAGPARRRAAASARPAHGSGARSSARPAHGTRRRAGRRAGSPPCARPSAPRRAARRGTSARRRCRAPRPRRPAAPTRGRRQRADGRAAGAVAGQRAARAAVPAQPRQAAQAARAHYPRRVAAAAGRRRRPAERGGREQVARIATSFPGRACRNSTRTSQSCDVSLDTSWTFAPGVLIALTGYAVVYGLRWRTARARGRRRGRPAAGAPPRGPAASLCLFVALVSPLDVLGEQMASFHMVQHLLIADLAPILLTLGADQAHPAPRHAPHPLARAQGRPVRPPRVRGRRLRRRDVALARPRLLRRGARSTPASTSSST